MKKHKTIKVSMKGGAEIKFFPNSEGTLQNAYVRVGDRNGDYIGSLDRKNKGQLRKLKEVCEIMLSEK